MIVCTLIRREIGMSGSRNEAQLNEERDGSDDKHAQFAMEAATRIRSMENCLYSLIPQDDLVRQAKEWYQACTEAALRGDFHLIGQWVRSQAAKAAEEGFALDDLLGVLRVCRQCVIDVERWNEDSLTPIDDLINETLSSLRGAVAWTIPAGINYLSRNAQNSAPIVTDTQTINPEMVSGERRNAGRCQLRLPIHIRTKSARDPWKEITKTANVSRTGLSFVSSRNYDIGVELFIVYPYWGTQGSLDKEYLARVVRKESLPEGGQRVAVRFLQSLGHKSDPITGLHGPTQKR
jgi:hypothetical protein